MAKLFSYVVRYDKGRAPNPFHGICTLAVCKPKIRQSASVGDWIVGTGSKPKGLEHHLVYAMRVTKTMPFDDYWLDPRFRCKRLDMDPYGDNLYRRDKLGKYVQDENASRCCGADTTLDTSVDQVLISDDFIYFGGDGPEIPLFSSHEICKKGPGHKCKFPSNVVDEFIDWIRSFGKAGCLGNPADWSLY